MKIANESRLPLIECDQLQQQFLNTDADSESDDVGFSSGYDSGTDPSDTESQDDVTSSDDGVSANSCHQSESQHTMVLKNTDALCEHLKYILSMPELCDVTFLVGPSNFPVHGVKAILGSRSRVMYQLILKEQKEVEEFKKSRKSRPNSRLTIDVHKYEPEDFRRIVQFIHCGAVDITPANVTGLLCGATQFGLDDLKTACWNFINLCRQSEDDSLSVMKRHTQKYRHFKAATRLLSKIDIHLGGKNTDSHDKTTKHSGVKVKDTSRGKTTTV